jgi:tetratricopeptide (TPR) repeat protein
MYFLHKYFVVVLALLITSCSFFSKEAKKTGEPTQPGISMLSESDPRYHFMLGKWFMYSNKLEEAAVEFQKALSFDPLSDEIAFNLAVVKLKMGNVDDAKRLLTGIVQKEGFYPEVHELLGRVYSAINDYDNAIKEFEKSLEEEKENPELYFELATLYTEKQDYQKAIDTFNRLLKIVPDFYLAYYYLAKIEIQRNNINSAIDYLKKSIEADKRFISGWIELGELYERNNKIDEAIDVYKQALEIVPDDISVHEKLAYLYAGKDDIKKAIKEFKNVVSLDSANLDYHLKLGIMYLEDKEYTTALDEFNLILISIPDSPVANYYMGLTYTEMAQYDKSREYLSKIKPESELYIESIIRIGFSYKKEGKMDDAINYVMSKINEGIKAPEFFRFTVALLQEARRYDEAINVANMGIFNFADSIELYYQLAFVYDEMENYDKAIEQMEKILKINPDHPDALNYIGYTWADRGINLEEAEEKIKKALTFKPEDGFIVDSLAWVHYQKGLYKQALKELEKALKLAGDDPIILEHLGDVHLKLNNKLLAIESYKKALTLDMREKDRIRIKKKYDELKLLH